MYYTVIKHDTKNTWVFDQSEHAQGAIYIIKQNSF